MNIKKSKWIGSLVGLVMLLAGSSSYGISLTPSVTALASGTDSSQSAINTKINAAVSGLDAIHDICYTAIQADLSEAYAFKDYYSTTFGSASLADADATISWDGPSFINAGAVYALIKDGDLGWYFYDISGWNGKDSIEFSSYFGGNQGKISHVSLYCLPGTSVSTSVPDGGTTVMLLGTALAGLGAARRFL